MKGLFGSLGVALGMAAVAVAAPAGEVVARDFLIAGAKPNQVIVVDAAARQVVQECTMLGRGSPISISPSPDGRIAYVVTNGWGEIVGVDLETCEEVFHADMSYDNVRVKTIAAMTVSRDGTEIYAQQSPVEIFEDRYNVLPTRIAVYRTDGGLDAQPVRTFEVPRNISILAPALDGEHLWAGGQDAYKIHIATGEIVETVPILNWDRPGYGLPDALAFWPLYEQTEVMVLPYFAPVFADDAQEELADFVVGTTRIDLETGEWVQEDITSADVLIFSMSLHPHDRNILYGAYTQLSKYDLASGELVDRVDLDHTYYSIQVSSDGREVYVGSTLNNIGVYDADTLEKITNIVISDGDQAAVGFRTIQR